jgi:hypothetical protein
MKRLPARAAIPWALLALASTLRVAMARDVIARPELSATSLLWPGLLLSAAFFTYTAVGALIAARRPANPVGWIFIGIGLSWDLLNSARPALLGILREPGVAPLDPHTWPALAWILSLLSNAWIVSFLLLPVLFLVFPSGRLLSPGWRPVLWLAAVDGVLGATTSSTQLDKNTVGFPVLPVVLGEAGEVLRHVGQTVSALGMLALYPLAVAALVIRVRRARGVEREQLLWFSYSCVLLVLVFVVTAVLYSIPLTRSLDPDAPFPVAMFLGIPFALAVAALPIASAVAILRHRLLDIDRLIDRTLVYGTLSTALLLTYVGAVVVLQALLGPITSGSELAVAASTLVVVALFQPLRRRIQDLVDRRFYRSRYDAARTLDAFTARMRDEVDLDAVRREVLDVVGITLRPAHASVWLRGSS